MLQLLREDSEGEGGFLNLALDQNSLLKMMSKISELSEHHTLEEQDDLCNGCQNPIPIVDADDRTEFARRCEFDGYWYCHSCHHNETDAIPARILANADSRPYPVGRQGGVGGVGVCAGFLCARAHHARPPSIAGGLPHQAVPDAGCQRTCVYRFAAGGWGGGRREEGEEVEVPHEQFSPLSVFFGISRTIRRKITCVQPSREKRSMAMV